MFFNIAKITFLFFPVAIITGPFLTNLSVVIIGLFYLFKGEKKFLTNKISLFFIFFCIFFIFSSIFSDYIFISLKNSLFFFRYYFFSLGVLTLLMIDRNILFLFNKILIIVILVVSSDVFIQLIFGKNLLFYQMEHVGRYSGLFGKELILGSFLSRVFPLSLALFFYSTLELKIKNKLLIMIYFLIVSSSVVISGERTALFFVILTLIYLIIYIKELRKIFFITSIVFSIILYFIINLSPNVKNRIVKDTYEQIFTYKVDSSIQVKSFNIFSYGHQKHLETAFLIFKDKFFIGSGPNTFDIICKKDKYLIIYEGGDSCSTHPHNSYAQLASETGLIGMFYFIIPLCFLTILLTKLLIHKTRILYFDFKNHHILILLPVLITLWPLVPSGSIFNSWLNSIYYLPLGILAYFFNIMKNTNSNDN